MDAVVSLAFYVIALITGFAAVMVVTLRNLLHAVLFLVLTFMGVAALYITLEAEFIAGVQVLIYAGAIAVLMIFAIMLTRNAVTAGNLPSRMQAPALLVSVLTLAVIVTSITAASWGMAPAISAPQGVSLYDVLFHQYVLPFEVASIFLLMAMIGAIVLAKD
ncbi:MAG: NADH-quinone oxidoreductase subunit J [Chloroflexi bacterium]|nr:NADH-quinone oxidoreductase subunit J [Chloroflexota bacterium]